ncbi:MAG: hypothetical protein LLG14_14855 [Nocardiaceae bacterium]|nr:hypothetical protein [Nocardiaceae bacterium]
MRRTTAIAAMFAMIALGGAGTATAVPLGPTDMAQPPMTLHPKPPVGPTDVADATVKPQPDPTGPETTAPQPTEEPEANQPTAEPAANTETQQVQPTRMPAVNEVDARAVVEAANSKQTIVLGAAVVLLLMVAAIAVTWLLAVRRPDNKIAYTGVPVAER